MTALHYPLFEKYAEAVRRYAGDASGAELQMASAGRVSVYYSPFDWINPSARLVIVGITPGRQQAENALMEAQRALRAGDPPETVLRRAKNTAAFSGALRNNLVALLDHVGLPRWLGIGSCEARWLSISNRRRSCRSGRWSPTPWRGLPRKASSTRVEC